jgi:hypothetical protein
VLSVLLLLLLLLLMGLSCQALQCSPAVLRCPAAQRQQQ